MDSAPIAAVARVSKSAQILMRSSYLYNGSNSAMFPRNRRLASILFAVCLSAAEPPAAWKPALDRISAQSLRGHLSFISSDLLEGRHTPSRGLDLAAEYIAAQFRRAGLEPAGGDGYFQTADMLELTPDPDGFDMTL